MEPVSGLLERHGRQGFFKLFVPDPPRGRPFAKEVAIIVQGGV